MEVLHTGNLPKGSPADWVSRWLVITRSSLLPLSGFAAVIGGLLAACSGIFHPLLWVLALLWLLPAQALNQLINDLFDRLQGIDTEDYARVRRSAHALAHGLTSRSGLIAAVLVLVLLQGAPLYAMAQWRGRGVWGFAAAALLLNLCCVAPPLKLKQRGLGELCQVFLWGPVMTGGTYYAIAGNLPAPVWLATIPYGVSVSVALLGMYLDRREMDETRWNLTLPVLLGEGGARILIQIALGGYYLLVAGLVSAHWLPWTSLLVLLSLPVAVRFAAALRAAPRESGAASVPRPPEVDAPMAWNVPPRTRDGRGLPPLPEAFLAWGGRWLRAATRTFAAGLAAGAVLGLIRRVF